MDEIWRDVKGCKGSYQVSNKGRVKKDGEIMKPNTSGDYETVYVRGRGTVGVHRLVAEAFLPRKEGQKVVNHIDGNKRNNHVSNLEWCTARDNVQHAIKNGLRTTDGGPKLTAEQVKEIKKLLRQRDVPMMEIARRYNVSRATISNINCGITWKHVD